MGGDGRRRKAPLDGAVDLWSIIWQHITTVSFVPAFIVVSTGKPKNACKGVWIGHKSIAVIFKSLWCWLFILWWSSKQRELVANLLCQPHLYLPPLLGFLKWLECLEVGFREVFRGLVSPTPFMESCDTVFCRWLTFWSKFCVFFW